MELSNRSGMVAFAVIIIIGIAIIIAMIMMYINVTKHTEIIYQQMIEEAADEAIEPRYGFGTVPDDDLVDNPELYKSEKKPKAIIYVYPTYRKDRGK